MISHAACLKQRDSIYCSLPPSLALSSCSSLCHLWIRTSPPIPSLSFGSFDFLSVSPQPSAYFLFHLVFSVSLYICFPSQCSPRPNLFTLTYIVSSCTLLTPVSLFPAVLIPLSTTCCHPVRLGSSFLFGAVKKSVKRLWVFTIPPCKKILIFLLNLIVEIPFIHLLLGHEEEVETWPVVCAKTVKWLLKVDWIYQLNILCEKWCVLFLA